MDMCTNLPKDKTVVILDWRIAQAVRTRTLQKHQIPWILMDRSPPADRKYDQAKLQWSSIGKRHGNQCEACQKG